MKNRKLLFGVGLLLVLSLSACECENENVKISAVSSGRIQINPEIIVVNSDSPNYFQDQKFYTFCIDGVNYLWEYYRDTITVKFNKDGTVSTCEMITNNEFSNDPKKIYEWNPE